MSDRHIDRNLGVSRRQVLKRGAIAGGALVWATPVVQSFGGKAFADVHTAEPGTPRCDAVATADAIDIITFDPGGDDTTVRVVLRAVRSCGECPEEDFLVTWSCREESDFTCDTPPDPSDGTRLYGGTITASDSSASVIMQADIQVVCEDGDTASDCRAELLQFEKEDGFWGVTEQTVVACV